MAKQVNKAVIGGFVISVIVMLIGGVILLGGGEMFKKKVKYVMFFEQSIKGLSKGAPLVFKGVEIGSVSNVVVDYDIDKLEINIPVIVEFDPSLVKLKGQESRNEQELRQRLNQMIERGLRARLGSAEHCHRPTHDRTRFFSGHAGAIDWPQKRVSRNSHHTVIHGAAGQKTERIAHR